MNMSTSTPKNLNVSILLLIIFCTAAGVLMHFAFDWSANSRIVALFAPVNESIWEHEKLLFFPFVTGAYFLAARKNIVSGSFPCLLSVLSGLIFIPCAYYTYTGALGLQADWFNIVIFILGVLISCLSYARLLQASLPAYLSPVGEFLLLLLLALFLLFTFVPPRLPLFEDPLTGSFGYQSQ